MNRIVLAPYQAQPVKETWSNDDDFAQLHEAIMLGAWPYDNGDDPSFFSAHISGGPVTWGICRQNERNQLRKGDVVLFFSFSPNAPSVATYRFCAVLTVERSIRQTDIFSSHDLTSFRQYLNLLIKPLPTREGTWVHHEPGAPRGDWHDDWLWRIASHSGLEKTQFEKLEAADEFVDAAPVGSKNLLIAANYIVFSRNERESYVVRSPRPVADAKRNGERETWRNDFYSTALKELTVTRSRRGSLRTANIQRPHSPCTGWEAESTDLKGWKAELISFLRNNETESAQVLIVPH